MKKSLAIALLTLTVIAGLIVIRFIIGGNEDTWICKNGEWIKHGNPTNPTPQEGCVQSKIQRTISPVVQLVNEKVTDILIQKYKLPRNKLSVVTTANTDSYAKGMVNFSEGGGGIWFAAKINREWELVFDGNGIITCGDLHNYPDFPSSLIPQCFDEQKNVLIKR